MHTETQGPTGPFIPTTARTVSKLKKAAKLRVRKDSIAHAEALELEAKAAGYHHWKHVTECEELSLPSVCLPTAGYTLANLPVLESKLLLSPVTYTVITGPSGIGKTVCAVAAGMQILAAGGTVLYLEGQQGHTQLIGTKPIAVTPGSNLKYPGMLLIIDELSQFQAAVQADTNQLLGCSLELFIETLLKGGVSILLVSQDSPESAQLAPLLAISTPRSVIRRLLKMGMH